LRGDSIRPLRPWKELPRGALYNKRAEHEGFARPWGKAIYEERSRARVVDRRQGTSVDARPNLGKPCESACPLSLSPREFGQMTGDFSILDASRMLA